MNAHWHGKHIAEWLGSIPAHVDLDHEWTPAWKSHCRATGKNTFFTSRLGSKFRISIARAEASTVNKLETSDPENKKGKTKNGSTQLVSERAEIEGEVIKHLTNYVKGEYGLESSVSGLTCCFHI
jgi:hypothetical protein